ncbi:MAG: phosphotransferase [Acidobacteriota bacterium]|nr:phosphotransferase [Acidobacteriota bacterium]
MTETAKAHGMDGTLVEPDWPPLTEGEVRVVLEQYAECEGPYAIETVSPRPFSAASVVRTGAGCAFVKRHARAVRDAEGLAEEHRFIEHLRTHGCSVPRVLRTRAGASAVESGAWCYEVHETPRGVDLYEDAISWTPFRCVGHAREAGRALARLHLAAEGFDAPARKARPLVASFTIFAAQDAQKSMAEYLHARASLRDDAETRTHCDAALEALDPFHQELRPLLKELKPLWTHNDLHASNLFWSGAGEDARATAVIDFGLADKTTAVHDLALALERNCVEWLALMVHPESLEQVAVQMDHATALLDGYEETRPLTDAEAAALAPMMALCHAEFALTEADYFLGVLRSREKARLAGWDYLVGHARWFRSAAGTRMLDGLRRWAERRRMRAHGAGRG